MHEREREREGGREGEGERERETLVPVAAPRKALSMALRRRCPARLAVHAVPANAEQMATVSDV